MAAAAPPNVRAALLALLTERPMHGYEMIQELDQRTGGVWRPSPGSVYPTLQLLEDEGLIASRQRGRPQAVHADRGRPGRGGPGGRSEPPWSAFAAETINSWQDIREAAMGAMNALRQVMRNGTDDQRARAGEVLDEARRKLYAILAEVGVTPADPVATPPGRWPLQRRPAVPSGEDEPAGAASRV